MSAPTKKSTVHNVKGFIYYIAKRVGVELNKDEVNNLSVEQLAEKIFDDPLVQMYFQDGKEVDVEDMVDIPADKKTDKEKALTDKFLDDKDKERLADDPKIQLAYIAKRTGVVFNEGGRHGLFGKIGDNKFGDIDDLAKTMDYVGKKVKNENMITYTSVISFSPEDAQELGYNNQEKFKELLQQNINQIAEKVGVPPSRLEYVGAVHLKRENPHMHFMFWDKAQEIKKAYVAPEISSGIRDDLIKVIYKDELNDLYKIKNTARDILAANVREGYREMAEFYLNLSPKKYLKEKRKSESKFDFSLDNRFKPHFIKQFGKEFLNISKRLPKKGSLKFEYLEPRLKERITTTVKNLIAQNEDFSREYNSYINSAVDIAKMYSKKPELHEEARKNAEDEILKRMSNQLLKALKEVKKYDRTLSPDKQSTADVVISIFRLLSRANKNMGSKHDRTKGELSKQAKIELAKKLEGSSNMDWEQDR